MLQKRGINKLKGEFEGQKREKRGSGGRWEE
jgi:hypothetical protein